MYISEKDGKDLKCKWADGVGMRCECMKKCVYFMCSIQSVFRAYDITWQI